MPINDIVAEVASRNTATLVETQHAPDEDGRPDGEPSPTTMQKSDEMLPPYLHIQTLDSRSGLMMVATVVTLVGFVWQVKG